MSSSSSFSLTNILGWLGKSVETIRKAAAVMMDTLFAAMVNTSAWLDDNLSMSTKSPHHHHHRQPHHHHHPQTYDHLALYCLDFYSFNFIPLQSVLSIFQNYVAPRHILEFTIIPQNEWILIIINHCGG